MKITRRSPGLFDAGDWTISLGSAYRCDGSHRPFQINLIHRVTLPGAGAPKSNGTRHDGKRVDTYTLTIPTLKFKTAYRLGRFALAIYRVQSQMLFRLARA